MNSAPAASAPVGRADWLPPRESQPVVVIRAAHRMLPSPPNEHVRLENTEVIISVPGCGSPPSTFAPILRFRLCTGRPRRRLPPCRSLPVGLPRPCTGTEALVHLHCRVPRKPKVFSLLQLLFRPLNIRSKWPFDQTVNVQLVNARKRLFNPRIHR